MVFDWQQEQWSQLMQGHRQGRLHHALLLYGQAGTGKREFAHALAQGLLCGAPTEDGTACGRCHACQLVAAGTHPDLHHLKPLPPKDSKAANPVYSIRIDAIRELCEQLGTTAQFDGRRVAVIEDADKMGRNAANSLLKTLEEPGASTHLILVSSQPHRLPITIRSRCLQVVFPVPPRELALGWLQQQGIEQPEHALQHSHGAPLAAASDDELSEGRDLMAKAVLARTKREPSLRYSGELAKLPRHTMLAMLQEWLADVIRIKSSPALELSNPEFRAQLESISNQADWRRLFGLNDELNRLVRYDAIALNNQLLWENLLISWDRL